MKKFSSTMKANSRRTSQSRKYTKVFFVGVLVLLVIFFVPKIFAFATSLVFTPINATKTWFAESSASFPQFLRNRNALIDEINALKQELATRSGATHTVDLLSKENESLRGLLAEGTQDKILAGIIGRPNQMPYDVLVLDRGYDDGVVEGAPVFVGESTVIGVIKKSFPHSAVVELITSPDFVASVYIVGPDIYTNAVGLGGGQLRVGVPQGIELHEGDLVILPSVYSGIYGEVSVVESVPSRPEQYGYVSPTTPLSSMRLVGVGRTPLAPISFEEAQEIIAQTKNEIFKVPVPDDILIQADSASSTATSTTDTATSSATSSDAL